MSEREGPRGPGVSKMKEADRMPHLVIRASAGSGKTHALSSRYLKLLRGGAEPESILATTFTRKAAGEILGRVLTRLAGGARDEASAEALGRELEDPALDLAGARRVLGRLVESMHRVSISTLDSFFNRMAGCFRFELGLPASPRLVSEQSPVARQLRRRAIDAMLGDEDLPTLMELLRRLHHDQARRGVTDALDTMMADLHGIYRQTPDAAWDRLTELPTLKLPDVVAAVDRLAGATELVEAHKSWAKAWGADLERAHKRDWENFLGKGIAKVIAEGRETYRTKKPLPQALVRAYRPLVLHAKARVVNRVAKQTGATHKLLKRFDAHFARLRREQGVVLFADLPHLLSDPVGGGELSMEALYYRLDGRVGHLLLDEFQDTSPRQWAILRPFAQEITAGVGADDAPGPARSLFCVGDVKQAIYGWRGGCAEVLDQVVADLHLPASAVHTSRVSYRSAQVVLDVVNEVFEGIADLPPLADMKKPAEAWERGFEPHLAQHKDRPGYVELAASPPAEEGAGADEARAPADDDDEEKPRAPAADDPHICFVADRIAALHDRHPGRSIGVLARTNATAASILDQLRRRGLHASGEGGTELTTDPAVELVASALTMADHPGHSAAAFHVRHSPLARPLGLSSLARHEVDAAAGRIRLALAQDGYARALTAWARHLVPSCNRRSARRLEQLVELAQQYDPAATLRASDFVDWIDAERVEDPSAAPVRVMTTHRAKGLQFDIVVLTELEALIGKTGKMAVWQYREEDKPTDPPAAVFCSAKKEVRPFLAEHNPAIEKAFEQERDRRVADDLSALYVAMTRPRYALHMLLKPLELTKDGKGFVTKGLRNASPASVLRHALSDTEDPEISGTLLTRGDRNWDASPAVEKSPAQAPAAPAVPPVRFTSATGPTRSWTVVSPSRLEGDGAVDAEDLLRIAPSGGQAWGTQVHDELAQVVYADRADASALSPRVARMLEEPAVRAALSEKFEHEELWRERAFVVRGDRGRLVRGAFDRVAVARDARGRATAAHLVDFKTDRAPDDAALRARVRAYQPQVEAYRRALVKLLGIDADRVTAELVFVGAGRAVAV